MQLLTNEIQGMGMRLMTTKCLNTAVMMWYLFLGDEVNVGAPVQCDSRSVRDHVVAKRETLPTRAYAEDPSNPRVVLAALQRDLLAPAPPSDERTLFYVMLTDADLPRATFASTPPHSTTGASFTGQPQPQPQPQRQRQRAEALGGDATTTHSSPWKRLRRLLTAAPPSLREAGRDRDEQEVRFFPGHVFVVEKIGGVNRYNLYQSYIDAYTLAGHAAFNKSFSVSEKSMRGVAHGLLRLYSEPCWSPASTAFWKHFAHVDASEFEGFQFSEQSFVCYRTAKTHNCVQRFRDFLRQKRRMLSADLRRGAASPRSAYGDTRLYTGQQRNVRIEVLSNAQMLAEIDALLAKM